MLFDECFGRRPSESNKTNQANCQQQIILWFRDGGDRVTYTKVDVSSGGEQNLEVSVSGCSVGGEEQGSLVPMRRESGERIQIRQIRSTRRTSISLAARRLAFVISNRSTFR